MPACLVVDRGDHSHVVYLLEADVTTLGRGETNDIASGDPFASREHARVRRDGATFVLEDLGSKNGVFVNGARVAGLRPLAHGDVITLAGLSAVFKLGDETFTQQEPEQKAGEHVRVDLQTAEVWVEGQAVSVTAKEFLALRALAQQHGGLLTKDQLAGEVWPEYQGAVGDYNIEQLISRLRRKLEPEPAKPRWLLTVRGLGYRLLTT